MKRTTIKQIVDLHEIERLKIEEQARLEQKREINKKQILSESEIVNFLNKDIKTLELELQNKRQEKSSLELDIQHLKDNKNVLLSSISELKHSKDNLSFIYSEAKKKHDSKLSELKNISLGSIKETKKHLKTKDNIQSSINSLVKEYDGLKTQINEFKRMSITIQNRNNTISDLNNNLLKENKDLENQIQVKSEQYEELVDDVTSILETQTLLNNQYRHG